MIAAALLAVVSTTIAVLVMVFTIWISDKGERLRTAAANFVVFLTIYCLLNILSSTIYVNDPSRVATFTEAQEASGFTSGYEYPLVLGDKDVFYYHKEEATSGLFYFRMTSQTISGSSISISYEHADGVHEIIAIPIAMINFRIVDNSEDTSLVVDLGAINAPAEGYTIENSCSLKVVWGWWVHDCGTPTTLIAPGDEGVAGLMRRAFASTSSKIVTMTVTQEQYNRILGAMESS